MRKFNSGKLDGTIEERKLIQKYNDLYMNDEKWKTLIEQLKNIKGEVEQEKIADEFLKSEFLKEQEKELYQKNNDMINKEKEKTVEKPKVKVLKLNNNKGFTNVILLALTTGFFGGMLTTMVIEILKIKSM